MLKEENCVKPKKVAISYTEIYDSVKKYFQDKDIECDLISLDDVQCDLDNYDLIVTYDKYDLKDNLRIINIHPSLFPAYKEKNAVIKAFKDGVKVSGITIHKGDKIIAQYPILIGIDSHIDDFINEIHLVSGILVPKVVETILTDRVFDFNDLFDSNCSKHAGCSECKGCR